MAKSAYLQRFYTCKVVIAGYLPSSTVIMMKVFVKEWVESTKSHRPVAHDPSRVIGNVNPRVFFFHVSNCVDVTQPPKTNMEPKNKGVQYESPFQRVIFRLHVTFRGSKRVGVIDSERQPEACLHTYANAKQNLTNLQNLTLRYHVKGVVFHTACSWFKGPQLCSFVRFWYIFS